MARGVTREGSARGGVEAVCSCGAEELLLGVERERGVVDGAGELGMPAMAGLIWRARDLGKRAAMA